MDGIKNILNRLDFGFLISIIIGLIGLWYYLYQTIMEDALPPHILIHYIVTVFLVLTIYLCFLKGLSVVKEDDGSNKFQNNMKTLVKIYFYSWLPALVVSVLLLCTSIMNNDTSFGLCLLITLFVVVGFSIYKRGEVKKRWKLYLISSISIIVGFFFFIIILSSMSMSVTIKTDKELYHKGDIIYVMVKKNGYLFRPVISSVNGGSSKIKADAFGNTYSIPIVDVSPAEITVYYHHRMFNEIHWVYKSIHIAPN